MHHLNVLLQEEEENKTKTVSIRLCVSVSVRLYKENQNTHSKNICLRLVHADFKACAVMYTSVICQIDF